MRIRLTRRSALLSACAVCSTLGVTSRPAWAFEYQFDNGVEINFDNTVQYSVIERTAPESSYLGGLMNANDGDNNFSGGIVSNRGDLLTKFDINYQGYGFDTTVDSFYDLAYNQNTKQAAGNPTYNAESEPSNKFPSATVAQAGRNIELRNLFVYGSHTFGNVPVTLRVGRLVNIFGESLFFANNGIAYGTAPVDVERAVSVPNTQAKDLFLPVGQALLSVQPTPSITVDAYYMFEWEKFNFQPVGSYFSPTDILVEGAQRLMYFPPEGYAPGGYLYRAPDQGAANTGQFGIALHYDPPNGNYDIGLYALQYNDTAPQIYVRNALYPTLVAPHALSFGTFQLVYPEHIQIYGLSGSTTYGPTNFAGEVSVRTNEPLESSVELGPEQAANNSDNPAYAVGNTLHYQASAVYLGPGTWLWQGSSWLTEIAADSLLGITKNRSAYAYSLANGTTTTPNHMALGFRTQFTADYFHVLPNLDITVPIGLGYNFMGYAPDSAAFNNTGIDRGGDLTAGVSFSYLNIWTGGISYTRYIAPPGRDNFADRDFVQFNVERTF